MTPEETAWAAGLLEGEGTFFIGSSPVPYAEICCAMTDPDVLAKLQRIVGGTIAKPFWTEKSTKPIQRWQMSRRAHLRPVLLALYPHMGERRQAKIQKMLAVLDERDRAQQQRLKPCGTRAKYERGCRCEPCTRARYWHNVAMKEKRKGKP